MWRHVQRFVGTDVSERLDVSNLKMVQEEWIILKVETESSSETFVRIIYAVQQDTQSDFNE